MTVPEFYKATAPDGRSFMAGSTGHIDYGAALLSGEVDFVLDPSPQDLGRLRNSANL